MNKNTVNNYNNNKYFIKVAQIGVWFLVNENKIKSDYLTLNITKTTNN